MIIPYPHPIQEKDGKLTPCEEQGTGSWVPRVTAEYVWQTPDYITSGGRMTKNTIEGFHGLSLMYREERTDHNHYMCKSNMGICHKVYLGVNVGSGPSEAGRLGRPDPSHFSWKNLSL